MGSFRINGYGAKTQETLVRLDEAMQDWRNVAVNAHPGVNADYIRKVCDDVVARARLLSESSHLNFPEVAGFLLSRSRDWVLGGLPIDKIGGRMPKTVNDLGILKITEGGPDGEPLTGDELKRAVKPRILQ